MLQPPRRLSRWPLQGLLLASWIVAASALPTRMGMALSPGADRGHAFALHNCATCHAVERVGRSPWPEAPPFRVLHDRYPVEDLAESFAEGIKTGHPSMPEWRLDPGQISDLLAYFHTLEDRPRVTPDD